MKPLLHNSAAPPIRINASKTALDRLDRFWNTFTLTTPRDGRLLAKQHRNPLLGLICCDTALNLHQAYATSKPRTSSRVILTESHIVKIAKAMKIADLLRHSTVAPSVGSELPKIRTTRSGAFPWKLQRPLLRRDLSRIRSE